MFDRTRIFVSENIQVLTALGAIIGFSVSTWIQVYYMSQTLKASQRSNSIFISRELVDKFENSSNFLSIEESIINREQLYKGALLDRGGKYTWQELNEYLGFFEEIATYKSMGGLDLHTIDVLFGAHVLEAYLDADIRDYVLELRTSGAQPTALVGFQQLAEEIVAIPERAAQVSAYKNEFLQWGSDAD